MPVKNNPVNRAVRIAFLSALSTTFAVAGFAESIEEKIARAITAAPAEITDDATILDVDLSVLRAGTNGWTCLPGVYLFRGNKSPMCNNATWMKMMAANAALEDFSAESVGISYMLAGDYIGTNAHPMANVPVNGGVFVPAGARMMVLYPNMDEVADLPRDSKLGGPWLMWADTPYAHVMIPIVAK
jgi:hypothetical protein